MSKTLSLGPNLKADADPGRGGQVTPRSVLIALVLIPLSTLWLIRMEAVFYLALPTVFSIFFPVVFDLFVVICLNAPVRRLAPRAALRQGELITIYVLLSQATGIAGHSFMQILPQTLSAPRAWATPENDWVNLFGHLIPSWLAISDPEVVKGISGGAKQVSTLFEEHTLRAWAAPIVAWSAFICVLLFVMVCINALLRKQWTDRERLTYPIVQLPYAMVDPSIGLFRSRSMWLSFCIVGAWDMLSGLHVYYPAVPSFGIPGYNLGRLFTSSPWNAIGYLWLNFKPFVMGLVFLIPVDIAFSCWAFLFFWKAQLVVGRMAGWRERPEFPEQSAGAYIGLCMIALWVGRRHFRDVLTSAWSGSANRDVPDREPLSYRVAVLGLVGGFVLLVLFCWRAGMSVWFACAVLALYLMTQIGITRTRAEVGSPVHDLHFAGPEVLVVDAAGTRIIGPRSLSIVSLLWFMTRAHYSDPMPHQLEGYRMADRARMNQRHFTRALLIGSVFATVVAFFIIVDQTSRTRHVALPWAGLEPFNRLHGWLVQPKSPDVAGLGHFGFGVLMTVFLMSMRTRFLWWPLHPAGYAVSSSYAMRGWWSMFFAAWVIKRLLLKQGGVRALRQATPFFFGMILGEFVVGGFWGMYGIITGTRSWSLVM